MQVTRNQERWAEALMVQRLHGSGADAHVRERITSLAMLGEEAGVLRWREIQGRLAQLSARGAQQ